MFTGLVEEKGRIEKNGSGKITVKVSENFEVKVGDSVSVNGVCLTVTDIHGCVLGFDVMPETIKRSSLSQCNVADFVNLERAMLSDGRFGGHIVTGHIDGTGVITSVIKEGNSVCFNIECEFELLQTIVEKGSVALDGISLTVATVSEKGFCVYVIPHTLKQTTMMEKKTGSLINIETDILGKYIKKMFSNAPYLNNNKECKNENTLSLKDLEEMGF